MTTKAKPDRERTGLGMHLTKCDRMEFRYTVTPTGACVPWLRSLTRMRADLQVVEDLEGYGDPEHWWVASTPVWGRLG
jgi:hypothetical protein